MKIIITGGAGFIGSELVRFLIHETDHEVLNIDSLTYAANLESLNSVKGHIRYHFLKADISDANAIETAFSSFKPDAIMHLAAESHVDRSIDSASPFIQTNIIGTYTLLEAARKYYQSLGLEQQNGFRFLHVSTDEVYGSLGAEGFFTEQTAYDPRSPYSASKAASDHLVMAWFHTYKLPILMTNCSNNYGPFHFPEKLIPLVILNALDGKPLPIYGKGENIRDWLYVEDHVRALYCVLLNGKPGESYNIGGNNERTNLEVVQTICKILDKWVPKSTSYESQITFVPDRPGHDARYAIDATKIKKELGWIPQENFVNGIEKTVKWYLDNAWWWKPIREKKYDGERLGTLKKELEK